MRFYAFTTADPPDMIDMAIPDGLTDWPPSDLVKWCDTFITQCVEHMEMHPKRPLGVAGARLSDDQDPREWPNLPPQWALVNGALRQAAARYMEAHSAT